MKEREYVVICNRYRGIAGSLLFWGSHTENHEKRSFGGYTSDLDSCERYTKEEIENSSYKFRFYVSKDNYKKFDDIAIKVKQLKRLGTKMTIIYR